MKRFFFSFLAIVLLLQCGMCLSKEDEDKCNVYYVCTEYLLSGSENGSGFCVRKVSKGTELNDRLIPGIPDTLHWYPDPYGFEVQSDVVFTASSTEPDTTKCRAYFYTKDGILVEHGDGLGICYVNLLQLQFEKGHVLTSDDIEYPIPGANHEGRFDYYEPDPVGCVLNEDMFFIAHSRTDLWIEFRGYWLTSILYVDGLNVGDSVEPPEAPDEKGMVFIGWSNNEYENITKSSYVDACYVRYGDVDINDKISTADAVIVLKTAANIIQLSENMCLVADVNHDTKVNTADAVLILKYTAGMITQF